MSMYNSIMEIQGGDRLSNGLNYNGNKSFRLININERLHKGEILNKSDIAMEYGVTEKTIQRDIDDLRIYLAETYYCDSEVLIKYDRKRSGYYLVKFEREWLTNEEVLGLSKILLESRAFCKDELEPLLSKLQMQVTPNDRKQVEDTIRNEQFYYVPLKHNKKLLNSIWLLSQHITKNEVIEISYTRQDRISKIHEIKPIAIMFSEYYFYLIAFMADDSKDYPTVFRIDRIENMKNLNKKFQIPYKDRFNEGEFRKRVQFMYSGPLNTVKFEYSGPSIESVLDRLPTAEVILEKEDVYTVKVEIYGDGLDMWLRSQGDYIRNIKYRGKENLE